MPSEKMPSVWVVFSEDGQFVTYRDKDYATEIAIRTPGRIVEYVPREDRSITELPKEPKQYYTSNPGLYYCAGCRQTIPLGHPCGCHVPPSEARIREIREEIKSTCYFVSYDASGRMTQFQLIPKGEK